MSLEPPRRVDEFIADPADLFTPQSATMDGWYKGEHFNVFPSKQAMRENTTEDILLGWKPTTPLIQPATRVTAMGSCFAAHFIQWLAENGFNKGSESHHDRLITQRVSFENIWSLAQQFRWAFGEVASTPLWIDTDKEIIQPTVERARQVRDRLEQTDVLIMTLGLSEVWYDAQNNEPMWRAVPKRYVDPSRHKLKVLSVQDTIESFCTIERLRAQHTPNMKIVYTVSPVRIRATFRPISAVVANTVTKATIRAGLDEFLRSSGCALGETTFYFPAYEIVLHSFVDPYEVDNKHLQQTVVQRVLATFAQHYTDLDVATTVPPESGDSLTELANRISTLELRSQSLQNTCDERMKVIEELTGVAAERLKLIEDLDRVAAERLVLINRLHDECARLRPASTIAAGA